MKKKSLIFVMLGLVLLPVITGAQQTKPATPVATGASVSQIKPDTTITQSVFYDALALYWALRGHSAFPDVTVHIAASKVDVQSSNNAQQTTNNSGQQTVVAGGRTNTGPGATATAGTKKQKPATPQTITPSTTHTDQSNNGTTTITTDNNQYRIIESATGAVVVENLSGDPAEQLKSFVINQKTADSTKLILQILARNLGLPDNSTLSDIKTALAGNTWFNQIYDGKEFVKVNDVPGQGEVLTAGLGSMLSVNSLSQGIAQFLIERVNEELDKAFFAQLQKALQQHAELRILFPNTLKGLGTLQVTSYSQSLNGLKTAFQKDMNLLTGNIARLSVIPNYQTMISQHPPLTLLFAACDVISMAQQGKSPATILYKLDTASYTQLYKLKDTSKLGNPYNAVIKLTATISNAFIDKKLGDPTTTDYNWVSAAQVTPLLKVTENDQLFNAFMLLFSIHTRGISYSTANGKVDFYKMFNAYQQKLATTRYVIHSFTQAYTTINTAIGQLNSASDMGTRITAYNTIATQLLNLSGNCLNTMPEDSLSKTEKAKIAAVRSDLQTYMAAADTLASDIENKSYTAAINSGLGLVGRIVSKKKADDSLKLVAYQTQLKDSAKMVKTDIAKLKASIDTMKKDTAKLDDWRTLYQKYGTFIATVAESQNSTDVKNAIDAFALPTGSSAIKKQHSISWGLNAYAGFYHCWNNSYARYNLPKVETGFTAPIGLDFNVGLGKAGSLSVFGGLIDVGAIFAYQVDNSGNTVQSQIKLGQLLSPSVGLVYGLFFIGKSNIPLSIGVNHQWGPELKSIDSNGNSVLNSFTSRTNVFLAVDIPIINFHVSQK